MTFQDPNTTNVYQQPYEVSQTMNPKLYHCYDFKLKCKSKKKTLYWINTRKLNRVPSIE